MYMALNLEFYAKCILNFYHPTLQSTSVSGSSIGFRADHVLPWSRDLVLHKVRPGLVGKIG